MAGKTRCRRLQAMWATKRILCSRNQGQFISGSEGSSWWVCPGMSREARLMQRKIPHGCRFQTSRTAWTRTSGGRGCMRMRRIWCMHAYSMWKTQLKSLWHPSQQAILAIFGTPKNNLHQGCKTSSSRVAQMCGSPEVSQAWLRAPLHLFAYVLSGEKLAGVPVIVPVMVVRKRLSFLRIHVGFNEVSSLRLMLVLFFVSLTFH